MGAGGAGESWRRRLWARHERRKLEVGKKFANLGHGRWRRCGWMPGGSERLWTVWLLGKRMACIARGVIPLRIEGE